MDSDLRTGYYVAVGTSAAAMAAAGGIAAAGAVGGATVTAGGVTLAQGGSMTLAGQVLLEAGIAGAMLPVDSYLGGEEFSFVNLGRNWVSGGAGGAVGHWLGMARFGWMAEDMIAGFTGGAFDGLLRGEDPMTAGFYGMGSQLLFGGFIRYGGRWVPASWVFGPRKRQLPHR